MKFLFANIIGFNRKESIPFAEITGILIGTALSANASSDDGRTIFEQYCAMCHTETENGIPKQSLIASYPRKRIVDALINGAMQDQAYDMTSEEIGLAADYLKSIGGQQQSEKE